MPSITDFIKSRTDVLNPLARGIVPKKKPVEPKPSLARTLLGAGAWLQNLPMQLLNRKK